MTANQIAYWNLRETERSNVAREAETSRSNLARENETKRHNIANEQFNISSLNETRRANLEREHRDRMVHMESVRSNIANEGIKRQQLGEQMRANRAHETVQMTGLAEQARHNLQQEMLQSVDMNIRAQAQRETSRSNRASEALTRDRNQIAMLEANTERVYKEVLGRYTEIQGSELIQMNSARRNEINAAINKMKEDVRIAQKNSNVNVWNAANNSVNAVARMIDALFPG
nr:putative ORF1 [Marmot picobirnavirus]